MRLFVAAEPAAAVRTAAAGAVQRLRERLQSVRAARGIRWVPPENMHLTVWFLGELSDARAAAVLDAMRPPLVTPAFELHVSGFGAFPPSGPPRVLWMGVTRGIEELARAHDEVGERLRPWGFLPEGRAFSAHLTIGRVKDPPTATVRAALRQALAFVDADAGACRIGELTMFRSRTSPKGAVYERLLRVPLS
jgi:2'-5' RNA ligase